MTDEGAKSIAQALVLIVLIAAIAVVIVTGHAKTLGDLAFWAVLFVAMLFLN